MIEFSSAQADLWLGAIFWPLVRILAMVGAAPLFSHRAIPLRAKVALAVAFALAIAPNLPPQPLGDALDPAFFGTLARNVMIGLALGFTVRIVFTGIELAGQVVGLQVGLSFGGFFNPEMSDTDNPVANFVSLVVLMLFLSLDGHLAMLAALQRTFDVLPIAGPLSLPVGSDAIVRLGAEIFSSALSISLPILAVMLLLNLVMGVMARVAPQLNLFSVGFPLSLCVGLLLLLLFLPYMGPPMRAEIERALALWPVR